MKFRPQTWAFVLLLALLGATAAEERNCQGPEKSSPAPEQSSPVPEKSSPVPEESNAVSCSAFASLSIRVTDVGSCRGVARANCEAIANSQNVFKDAYDNWWAEEGICDGGKATAAAEAVAEAMAQVYADAIAKVSCTNSGGFACGWAISNGEAFGISFATALAQASADAGQGDEAEAFCATDVVAKGGAIAEAAAQSQASACVRGRGSDIDFESAFVSRATEIIAEAFAEATADACSNDVSTAQARTRCEARSSVNEDSRERTITVGGGFAEGSSSTIPDCTGAVKNNCCASEYRSRRCVCRGCNGPLVRLANFDNGGLRTWRDIDSAVCKCV